MIGDGRGSHGGSWSLVDSPTGLNGTQCVPEGALACTSTHLVDGRDLGVQEKSPGWNGVTRYVRIVEFVGSSPITSTEKSRSDPITHLCLDRYAPRRDSMCSLAEANRCADLAADSTRCGAPE